MDTSIRPNFRRAKYKLLAVFTGFQFVYIFLAVVAGRNIYFSTILAVVASLGYGVAILGWCRLDSLDLGYPLSRKFAYAVVLFGTLSLIVFFFRSRGFLGGVTALLAFLGFWVMLLIVDTILIAVMIVVIAVATRTPIPQ